MKMKENKTLQWLPLFLVRASFFFLLTSSEEAQADTINSVEDGIRIDCGAREDYTDLKTKFSYKADDFRFVEYGEAHNVSSDYTKEQIGKQLKTLRSFREGKRNCYTVPITPSNNGNTYYLVRTFFAYGNYDNGTIPSFDLYIGVSYWATFNETSGDIVLFEVIHVSSTDKINVCLVNTGHGTPFISLLEVIPWQNSRYDQTALSFLRLMSRSKLGMSKDDNDTTYIRYPNDIYGRSWFIRKMENSERINAPMAIDSDTSENTYKLPKEVLSSAVQSVNASSSLVIDMVPYNDHNDDYYVYLHFYDFVNKSQNQQRKMVISFSDGVTVSFALEHLKPTTLVRNIKSGDDINNISIRSTSDSQLPAMLNAYEIYRVPPQQQVNSTTDEGDVVAIQDIKRVYSIKKISWQGDPCGPMDWRWEGLICNNTGTPRITSINLSFSSLPGKIVGSFSNFPELKVLNLSNNNLTGKIPESLAEPPKLINIILTGNKIKGPIPPCLEQKIKARKLNMSVDNLEDSKNNGTRNTPSAQGPTNSGMSNPPSAQGPTNSGTSNPPSAQGPTNSATSNPPTPSAQGPTNSVTSNPLTPSALGPTNSGTSNPPTPSAQGPPNSVTSNPPTPSAQGPPNSVPSNPPTPSAQGPPNSVPSNSPTPSVEVPPNSVTSNPPTPSPEPPPPPPPQQEVAAIVLGTVGGSAVILGLAYTLKIRFGLRFDICKQRKNESRSGTKNDEGRRSGEKKEDCESEDKTTVSARVKATNNTGEGGSESLISKARDAIQEQIPCL
ncbi:hypothetical protein K1719_019458 [Acacia pycnantha]|nr:hypothetical protein K1719_019458 [Acacia pycnantha]